MPILKPARVMLMLVVGALFLATALPAAAQDIDAWLEALD